MSTNNPPTSPPALGLDRFAFDSASRLLDCLCTQLALTIAGPVCRCCLYASDQTVPMDVCCECKDRDGNNGHGQAAVRVYRIFPMTGRLPQQDYNPRQCNDLIYGVTFEMTVYRCMATIDQHGQPPTCDALTMDVARQMDDAAAMRAALRCCFAPQMEAEVTYSRSNEYVEDDWNPIGPAGGCGGGRQRVTIQVFDCPCDAPPLLAEAP